MIDGRLEVRLLASRAAAWSGKAFSFIEHIPAGYAAEREHNELPFLCHCRQCDVRKMLVDFPFPNADSLGDFPGGHFFVIQEEENLLADGLRTAFIAHDQLCGERVASSSSLMNLFNCYFLILQPYQQYP